MPLPLGTKKARAAVPKTLPIKKKKKPAARVKKPKRITSEGLQRQEDVMKAAGFSKRHIQSEMEKAIFARAEKSKRKEAAKEFGAAP